MNTCKACIVRSNGVLPDPSLSLECGAGVGGVVVHKSVVFVLLLLLLLLTSVVVVVAAD